MASTKLHRSDVEIISLLSTGTFNAWEYLYDKYSPLMYGTIMREVGYNKIAANEMLMLTFVELQKNHFSATSYIPSLPLFLVQHCNRVIKNHHSRAQLNLYPTPPRVDQFPLLKTIISYGHPLKIIAAKIGITESNAMATLRSELKEARIQVQLTENLNRRQQRGSTGDVFLRSM